MSNTLSRRAVLGTAAAISAFGSAHAANTIRVYESGDSGGNTVTLRMVKRPTPVAGPGQVVMMVHATGLNARLVGGSDRER